MYKHSAEFQTFDGKLHLVLDGIKIPVPSEAKSHFFGLIREAMDEGSRQQRIKFGVLINKLILKYRGFAAVENMLTELSESLQESPRKY